MRTRFVALIILIALFLSVGAVQADEHAAMRGGFTNASLQGTYAATGGNAMAGIVGICHLDGNGAFDCTFTSNLPGEDEARTVYASSSKGEYNVNPNGTGTIHEVEMMPDGTSVEFDHDFVITAAEAVGPYMVATEVRSLIRQAADPSGMLLSAGLTRLPDAGGTPMMSATEQNKAAVLRFFEEGFNRQDLDAFDTFFADDVVDHLVPPDMPAGLEGVKLLLSMYFSAFPDIQLTVEDMVAEGDKVSYRWSVRGTHEGELMGIPASGQEVEISGMAVDRFENGKAVEHWEIFDQLGMLQQIGAIPTP